MFKLEEIKQLMTLLDESSLHELELENEGFKLSIRKPQLEAVQVMQSVSSSTQTLPAFRSEQWVVDTSGTKSGDLKTEEKQQAPLHRIVSPMVGTFYRSPTPDTAPFANVGDRVLEGSVVCIIEAMKLMNELEAEIQGEIVHILVENGQLVDYGQPLFLVRPTHS